MRRPPLSLQLQSTASGMGCSSVYIVCMARLNVYVPDELAERARAHGLNVSALTQAAIESALRRTATRTWLSELPRIAHPVPHDAGIDALDAARDKFGADS